MITPLQSSETVAKSKKLFLVGGIFLAVAITIPFGREKAEAIGCSNTMISICFAARYWWGEDHDGYLPSSLVEMSNELATPKLLICPGDHARRPAANWDTVTSGTVSYEIVTPRLLAGDSNGVFLHCKVHPFVGYADGSVYDGKQKLTK
jgi:hypothetical protein